MLANYARPDTLCKKNYSDCGDSSCNNCYSDSKIASFTSGPRVGMLRLIKCVQIFKPARYFRDSIVAMNDHVLPRPSELVYSKGRNILRYIICEIDSVVKLTIN